MANDEPKAVRESGRRLAAIMFTDMVGYSALTEKDEAGALRLLEVQTRLIEPILVLHGGRIVRTMGDGTFIEFGSAVSACKAALNIQEAIAQHNSDGPVFQIRIGVHLGDVEVIGDDLLGHGVNVAARIEPLAEPGGVCVSEDIARQVTGKIGAELVPIGTPQLKGIEEEVAVFKVVRTSPTSVKEAPQSKRQLPSVAILPFANLSPDPENEHFGDGLTEEILWALSKIRTLAVVSRTSCFAFKGTTKPVKEVGNILGVDHVLEGSVRKAGSRIRITVQLVDIAKDRAIYSDKFDRELEDIFAIQEDITQSIIEALQIAISESERGAITGVPTRNIKAYEAYVRANAIRWATPSRGVSVYQEVIGLDPNFAKAHAMLSVSALTAMRWFASNDVPYLEIARQAAQTAINLDPNLSEAHMAAAEIAFHEGRVEEAIASYELALDLDPNSYDTLYNYGRMMLVTGDDRLAIKQLLRAAEVRPDEYQPLSLATSRIGLLDGRHAELEIAHLAIERVERRLRCCPTEARAYILGALLYQRVGNQSKALEYVEKALKYEPSSGTYYNVACFYCLGGEFEKAIETLEKSYELGINFAEWIRRDLDLESVVDDPRVQTILEKMEARMSTKSGQTP